MAKATVRGTAVILGSNRDPDVDPNDSDTWREDGLGDALGLVGMPYEFDLEVTVPGADPSRVTIRSKVPAKAERISLLQSHPIPPSLVVPVEVSTDDPTKVRIDWDAFLAQPDRVAQLKAARERGIAMTVQRSADAQPEKYAAQRAQNKTVVMGWAESVRAGSLTREVVERDAAVLIRLGFMDPADLAAALARIDEP
jgi:hypothetical protein